MGKLQRGLISRLDDADLQAKLCQFISLALGLIFLGWEGVRGRDIVGGCGFAFFCS